MAGGQAGRGHGILGGAAEKWPARGAEDVSAHREEADSARAGQPGANGTMRLAAPAGLPPPAPRLPAPPPPEGRLPALLSPLAGPPPRRAGAAARRVWAGLRAGSPTPAGAPRRRPAARRRRARLPAGRSKRAG